MAFTHLVLLLIAGSSHHCYVTSFSPVNNFPFDGVDFSRCQTRQFSSVEQFDVPSEPNEKKNKAKKRSRSKPSESIIPVVPEGNFSDIFAMAARMFDWSSPKSNDKPDEETDFYSPLSQPKSETVLPRWRPVEGVSDVNPKFRSNAPEMSAEGYANIIRRNSRKRQPGLWRYALRLYAKMDSQMRTEEHHLLALVLCGKLGLWRQAYEIWLVVAKNGGAMSEYMLFALIKASVRGARSEEGAINQKRKPLDALRLVLTSVEVRPSSPSSLFLG